MIKEVEEELFKIPTKMETDNVSSNNFSFLISDIYDDVTFESDSEYEQFLADVWQWKRSVEDRRREDVETGNAESESLPSYTIASGLPSYQEALDQLKKVKEAIHNDEHVERIPDPSTSEQTLSIIELFQNSNLPAKKLSA